MTEDERELARLLRSVRDTSDRFSAFSAYTLDELRDAGMAEPSDFTPQRTISGIERAEAAVVAGMSQIRANLTSGAVYAPDYEATAAEAVLGQWQHDVGAWESNLHDHVVLVENALAVVNAQLENPRATWPAAKVAESEQHLNQVRRALQAYSLANLESQLIAALNGDRPAVLDAWREALLERAANGQQDELGERWLERLSAALATDPQLVRLKGALTKRLVQYAEGQRKVSELTRARAIEINQRKMIESGRYGQRAGDAPTIHNQPDVRGVTAMRDLTDEPREPRRVA